VLWVFLGAVVAVVALTLSRLWIVMDAFGQDRFGSFRGYEIC